MDVPDALEAVVTTCQIVAGHAIGWWESPEDAELLSYFGDLPKPASLAEAIAVTSVLSRFVQRLGTSVHDSFHRRYRRAACALGLPMIEAAIDFPIEMTPGSFVCDWLLRYRTAFDAAHDTPAQRSRKYLEQQFTRNITSAELAKAVGIQRRTLDRQFRAEIGLTVTEYRTRLRVLEALRYLRAGEKPEAIALLVGWRARKDLYRALRKLGHVLPSELRDITDEQTAAIAEQIRSSA